MIRWRVHRTIKNATIELCAKFGIAKLLSRPSRDAIRLKHMPRMECLYHCEIDLAARRFTFLNDSEILPTDVSVAMHRIREKPLLWQFHFDYHDYLAALLSNGGTTIDEALAFIMEYGRANPVHARRARRSVWHPYVLSIRIEAWIRVYAFAIQSGLTDDESRLRFLAQGIDHMTRVLLRNLEFGTMANHLFRNIKALMLAGLFLDGETGKRAWETGSRLLQRELIEQILDDGMHFERSPMYHVSVMNDVLDLLEALRSSDTDVPRVLEESAAAMTGFLEHVIHPDGEMPFFNDSTESFFLRTPEVFERGKKLFPYAHLTTKESANIDRFSGLHVHRDEHLFVVFDAGLIGPDYQVGHAHCDTLSFELSWNGKRLVTDTGVFHYKESSERSYSRSTAAHNTIRIDDVEQSEVWKSFRVGERARIVSWKREARDGLVLFRGTHDGFTRKHSGLLHERVLVICPQRWMVVLDFIHGKGKHLVESFLHFHPDAQAFHVGETVTVQMDNAEASVYPFGTTGMHALRTEYYPRFGEKVERMSFVFSEEASLPFHCGYAVVFRSEERPTIEPAGNTVILTSGASRIVIPF